MADIDKLNIDSIIQRLLEGEGVGGRAEGRWAAPGARGGGGSWEAGWACSAEGSESRELVRGARGCSRQEAGWGPALGPTRGPYRLRSFIARRCSFPPGDLKTPLPTPTFPVRTPLRPASGISLWRREGWAPRFALQGGVFLTFWYSSSRKAI